MIIKNLVLLSKMAFTRKGFAITQLRVVGFCMMPEYITCGETVYYCDLSLQNL